MSAYDRQMEIQYWEHPGELSERLRAPDWPEMAARCKRRFRYRCAVCFSPNGLNAHHRTYVRLWQETDEDLTCLCRKCHWLFHRHGRLVAWEPFERRAA